MIFNKASRVVGALATIILMQGVASAASVGAGQFNIAGSIYITNHGFFIGTDAMTAGTSANQTSVLFGPVTGPFTGLVPTTLVPTKNLSIPPVVIGTNTFTLPQWIVLPNGIDLDLTGLPASTQPVCAGATNGPCQAIPGSPITLNSIAQGVSATFNVSGVAYDASTPSQTTPFAGIFTAQFIAPPDTTISGLLDDFNTNGFITTSFSATLNTTTPSSVPEPGSMALIGAGLFGLGLFGKRKFVK